MPVDETKLNVFMGAMRGEMGAAMSAALVLIVDRDRPRRRGGWRPKGPGLSRGADLLA